MHNLIFKYINYFKKNVKIINEMLFELFDDEPDWKWWWWFWWGWFMDDMGVDDGGGGIIVSSFSIGGGDGNLGAISLWAILLCLFKLF